MEPQSTQTIEAVNTVSISDFWDPLYDSFDLDLVMKVLAHTAFSAFYIVGRDCNHT